MSRPDDWAPGQTYGVSLISRLIPEHRHRGCKCPRCGAGMRRNDEGASKCRCGYSRPAPPTGAAKLAIAGVARYEDVRERILWLIALLQVGQVWGVYGSNLAKPLAL